MATEQPLWLQLVLRFERAIGVPVESALRSDTYFDLLTHANRIRARLTEVAEGVTEEWLHVLNVPASSDVKRLREQLARVERQLGRLAKEIEERDGRGEDTSRGEDG
jgi:ubiquinone biosynthesis protein UbiJ